jgi:hypothetical protein
MLDNNCCGSNSAKFIAEVISGPPPTRTLPDGIIKVSEVRYYRINRIGSSGTDFKITLPYGADDGVADPANLTIVKDNGAGAWINIGGTASGPVPGTIQSDNFNGFSDFVLANKAGGSNPLPVSWVSFTARRVNADAQLEWKTAREQRCNIYEVERSADGANFREIGNELCRNNQSEQVYHFLDMSPGKGTFYYRLRQVDTDGRFEYSPLRKVSFGEESNMLVYPNPVKDKLQIANITPNTDIRLYDALGRIVLQLRCGQSFTTLQLGHLPSGIYELLITNSAGERTVKKVQIRK